MNKVQLAGTLQHVKPLTTKENKPGARFMVRVPRERGGEADLLPAVAWDRAASDIIEAGDDAAVTVTGKLSRRKYNDQWETSITIYTVSRAAIGTEAHADDSGF
jgi:single-stranded DNA-binding protein